MQGSGQPAQGWLTRTLACLCASASTASECCSPAGSLTSLLKDKARGGRQVCSTALSRWGFRTALPPLPPSLRAAQQVLISQRYRPDLSADGGQRRASQGLVPQLQVFYITDAIVELCFSLSK